MRQLKEIRRNLWTYEASASGISVRGAVVVGTHHAAVWDTLTHPTDVSALNSVLGDKPFHVIYSHADWDHCWGTGGFRQTPLATIGHAECRRRFDVDVPRTLNCMQLAEPGKWIGIQLVPPDLTFSTRMTLDLGGVTLELHHLPGHTVDSIIGWVPEWGVLLGGDAIETPLPVVNSALHLGNWLAHLETWAALTKLSLAIPSHGSTNGRDALDQTVSYLRTLTGDRDFELPPTLDDFYDETHRKNLLVLNDELDRHD